MLPEPVCSRIQAHAYTGSFQGQQCSILGIITINYYCYYYYYHHRYSPSTVGVRSDQKRRTSLSVMAAVMHAGRWTRTSHLLGEREFAADVILLEERG
jgi:hypothetical protein